MGADDENDFTQVYGRLSGIVLAPNPATYVSRPSGDEPFRSGVNASHLRSPQRSGENAAAMSQDGRFTVFLSAEDDLSADDDDRFVNVYRRDNLTGETMLVSRADGAAGRRGERHLGHDGRRPRGRSRGSERRSVDLRRRQPHRVRERRDEPRRRRHERPARRVRARRRGRHHRARQPRRRRRGDPAVRRAIPRSAATATKVAFVTRFEGDPLDGNSDPDVYLRDLAAGTTAARQPAGADRAGRRRRLGLARDRRRRQPRRVRHRRDRPESGDPRREHWTRTSGCATSAPGRSRW